jgi:hypothetical protein
MCQRRYSHAPTRSSNEAGRLPLLAQSRLADHAQRRLLLGVKRTSHAVGRLAKKKMVPLPTTGHGNILTIIKSRPATAEEKEALEEEAKAMDWYWRGIEVESPALRGFLF